MMLMAYGDTNFDYFWLYEPNLNYQTTIWILMLLALWYPCGQITWQFMHFHKMISVQIIIAIPQIYNIMPSEFPKRFVCTLLTVCNSLWMLWSVEAFCNASVTHCSNVLHSVDLLLTSVDFCWLLLSSVDFNWLTGTLQLPQMFSDVHRRPCLARGMMMRSGLGPWESRAALARSQTHPYRYPVFWWWSLLPTDDPVSPVDWWWWWVYYRGRVERH